MIGLGLDTATRAGSVAVLGGAGTCVRPLARAGEHARDLLPAIESLLAETGVAARDLQAIGVAAGPGSFTGVRVGLATAKGLGYALDVVVVGISTLEAMALAALRGVRGAAGVLCPLLRAGRGEVYAALFSTEEGGLSRLQPDRAWDPRTLHETLPAGAILVGDGAGDLPAAGRRILELPPLAGAIAARACQVRPEGAGYRMAGLGPHYIRPADAEAARQRT